MNDMPKHPRLHRRKGSSNYHFRARVPQDLLDHYRGKREITFSLGTSVYKEAVERVRVESVRLDEEFAEVRRKRAAVPVQTLGKTEIDRLVLLLEYSVLEADDAMRLEGDYAGEMYERRLDELEQREKEGKEALARGNLGHVQDVVEDWLLGHNIELAPESAEFRTLAFAFLKARVRLTERLRERMRGEVVETPPQPAPLSIAQNGPQEASGGLTLAQAHELWAQEHRANGGPQATIDDFGVYVRRFMELHGNLPVAGITKAHVREFKDAMLKYPARMPAALRSKTVPQLLEYCKKHPGILKPLSPRTVNDKCMGAIGAILGWATQNGYLEHNPAAGVKVKTGKVRETARLPYSIDDMNRIFRFPIYTSGDRPKGGGGEAAYWLPLLAAFTGARLEELGQLTVDDIKEERGVLYFDMTTITEGKRRKTESSKRRVPVHPTLVDLGFIDYVSGLSITDSMTAKRIFKDITSGDEKITTAWSKWWGRYAREYGEFDRLKVFHSFRHTVKDGLRESGVPEDLRDALQGHAATTEGGKYGSGFSLASLDKAMRKLVYPGLDLSHLTTVRPDLPAPSPR